jgi:hypothetical protein
MTLAGGALAAPGFPERSVVEDANDVKGRLDVAEVRYVHDPGAAPVWTVRTYGEWRTVGLWDTGFVWIDLDTRSGPEADYTILLRADRSRMRGALFRITSDPSTPDPKVADVRAWRPTLQQVAVRLPLSHLTFGEARTTFRWWVTTSFTGDACPRVCLDLAPDDPLDGPAQDAPGGPPPA